MGLHGGEDREESFLAATLNIFFELRLAPQNQCPPLSLSSGNFGRERERERENLFFRETKEEETETVIVLVSSGTVCLSLILTRHFIDQLGPNTNKSYMSFIHTYKVKESTYIYIYIYIFFFGGTKESILKKKSTKKKKRKKKRGSFPI